MQYSSHTRGVQGVLEDIREEGLTILQDIMDCLYQIKGEIYFHRVRRENVLPTNNNNKKIRHN